MVDPTDESTVRDGIDGRFQNDQPGPVLQRKRQRRRRWPFALGGVILVVGILATVWDWDWFRPLESERNDEVQYVEDQRAERECPIEVAAEPR